MKHLHWITAALMVASFGLVGCDEGTAPGAGEMQEAAPQVEAPAAEEAVAEASVPASALGKAPVAQGAADLADEALKEVAIVDRPMESSGALCELTGNAGDTVECAVKLGVESEGIAARALQGTVAFDGARASMKGFTGEICAPNGECITGDISEAGLKTGHIVKSTPVSQAAANGRASFMVMNMSAPQTAISEAGAESAATIFNVAFVLSEDVRADDPIKVTLGNVVVADEAANQIAVRVDGATILTSGILKR